MTSLDDWKLFHRKEAGFDKSRGNLDSAIAHYEALAAPDPAWYNFLALGDAYDDARRDEDAARMLEPHLQRLVARERENPRWTKYSWMLALCYIRLRDRGNALRVLRAGGLPESEVAEIFKRLAAPPRVPLT